MEKSWIDIDYIHFRFDWSWIKDKQLIHRGNWREGMLIITDEDGTPVKILAYEMVSE